MDQHASGARHGFKRAIGKSCGQSTTKIHFATDANGLPIDFKIIGGDIHNSQVAEQFVDLIHSADYLIVDKGYDAEQIKVSARNRKMIPIIPLRSNSKKSNPDFNK